MKVEEVNAVVRGGVIPRICAAVVVSIAVLVLIGWTFDIELFKTVRPGMVGMNPLTATCFILAGVSLGIRTTQPSWWKIGALCAVLVFLVGVVRLAGYFFDFDATIDRLLFSEKLETEGIFRKNRMAPNTALGFIFSGAGLYVAGLRFRLVEQTRECLASATLLTSLLVLIGYAFGVSSLYGVRFFIPMALHTALSFLILGVGILFLHPRHGFIGELTGQLEGGAAARVLLPFAIGVPILFGWLRLIGVKAGWFSVELGLALVAVMSIVVMVAVTVWTASVLNRQSEARRRAEEALRESEARYHVLFDSIDEGFCIIEVIYDERQNPVDYRFLEVNPSFEKQTGIKDAQGKTMLEIAPQHERKWFELFGKISLTGEPARFEGRAEQLHRWYEGYAFRFGEPKNRQVAILFNDISERKRAEESISRLNQSLENANKELEAFSYSVSHDLRAPLRAIDGFSMILEEDHADKMTSEARRLLGVIRASTRQMGQLIDDLLAFSRLSRKGVEKMEVDVAAMVRSLVNTHQSAEPERSIRFELGDLPSALGDASMLHQVWVNLISNASKFTRNKREARIEIRGWRDGEEYIYSVKDNGAGFDMSYVEKLFGVFQRLHRADEFEGTGVGLAIVQRIVHRHGGRVWAEGKINEGAVFYFTLPAHTEKKS